MACCINSWFQHNKVNNTLKCPHTSWSHNTSTTLLGRSMLKSDHNHLEKKRTKKLNDRKRHRMPCFCKSHSDNRLYHSLHRSIVNRSAHIVRKPTQLRLIFHIYGPNVTNNCVCTIYEQVASIWFIINQYVWSNIKLTKHLLLTEPVIFFFLLLDAAEPFEVSTLKAVGVNLHLQRIIGNGGICTIPSVDVRWCQLYEWTTCYRKQCNVNSITLDSLETHAWVCCSVVKPRRTNDFSVADCHFSSSNPLFTNTSFWQ